MRCIGVSSTIPFVLALLLFSSSLSAHPPGTIEPPELVLEEVVQGPDARQLSWSSLRGKAVLVKLWATWCGPCVAGQEDWDRLVEEFDGQGVEFLAVTDEEPGVVTDFLRKKPMKGWVAVDADRSFLDALEGDVIPRVVMVGPEGSLRGIVTPDAVTPKVVRALRRGEGLELPDPRHDEVAQASDGTSLFKAEIQPSKRTRSSVKLFEDRYEAFGFPVREILPFAYDELPSRIVVEGRLPEERFDFIFHTAPRKPERFRTLLRVALESTFDLEVNRESREREVYILKALPEASEKLQPSQVEARGSMSQSGSISGTRVSTGELAELLELSLGQPVVDETQLTGEYDIQLRWQPGEMESLSEAVREELGLELEEGRREVEVLVIATGLGRRAEAHQLSQIRESDF